MIPFSLLIINPVDCLVSSESEMNGTSIRLFINTMLLFALSRIWLYEDRFLFKRKIVLFSQGLWVFPFFEESGEEEREKLLS